MPVGDLYLVIIENVGNLVCPSAFELGEAGKVVVLSVADGDDKPAKYPAIFAISAKTGAGFAGWCDWLRNSVKTAN